MKLKLVFLGSLLLLLVVMAFNKPVLAAKAKSLQPVVGLNLGNQAPEIAQKDPQGKIISLSSLRGQIVLIDFWASWCGPCRHENPIVKASYEKYRNQQFGEAKGYTIYSVSLDVHPQAWQAAIANDGLTWPNHVSDLQGWNSAPAALYGVTGIPVNFLINEKGIIIGKNLRGDDLLSFLERLSKKNK